MSNEPPVESPYKEIRAAGPGPTAEALRTAYLDLLKLSLCDLAGANTREVRWTGDHRLFSRELTDDLQVGGRTQGKDWPLDGFTMVGLDRLDDLRACIESIVRDGVPGDLIEAGAWRGGASIFARATLNSLGDDQRTVWVADSFQGFPVPEDGGADADRAIESPLSKIDFLAPSVEEVKGYFARFGCEQGVTFVPGFFEDTLPSLRGERWSLIRLDADTYKATRLSLEALYPGLSTGGYLVVDDYFHPFISEACREAVDQYRRENRITEPIEQIDWTGARWRKQREQSTDETPADHTSAWAGSRPRGASALPVAASGSTTRIPTDRELQLGDELAELAELAGRPRQAENRLDSSRGHLRRRWRRSG